MDTTNVRPVTADAAALWGDTIFASGTLTVTLPAPSWGLAPVAVKNTGTGVVTVTRSGTALIDGAATVTLSPRQTTTLVADGTAWRAVAATTGIAAAPTNPVATAGVSEASVAFTAPTANGGSPITSYTVTSTPGGVTATGASSPIVVPGLTAGTAYTFTVRANTAAGNGAESVASNSVTPTAGAVAPPAPTIGTATSAGATSVTVTHTTNGSGGSPITGCTITPYIAGVAQTAQTFTDTLLTHTLTGLTTGTAYTFKVALTNSIGTGAQSAASNSATPTAPGFTDSLNRANGPLGTASDGKVWTQPHTGQFVVDTNKARNTGGLGSLPLAYLEAGAADGTLQMTVDMLGAETGMLFRYVDANNYWQTYTSGANVGMQKVVAGVATQVGGAPVSPTTGVHTWKVVLLGSSIRTFIDNVLKHDATDATHQTATKHGLSSGVVNQDLVTTYDDISFA